MKANRKNAFKKIIKLAADDKPVANFTDMVMNSIEADVQHEAALKLLLQQQPTEGPAFNFTSAVMAQITKPKPASVYKPIITKKAWYGIAAMVAIFLTLIGLSNSSNQQLKGQHPVASLLQQIDAIPTIYIAAIIIAGSLIFLDYLITQRLRNAQSRTI